MQSYKNLILIGTSHIAETSMKEVEKAFEKYDPDIIAVELDKNRLHALLENKKPDYSLRLITEIGFKGYLFAVIGGVIQQKLGNIVGIKPGSDMLKAVELARDNKKKLALIDRDIRVTLARLSKAIKAKDKFNFFIDLLKSPFSKKMRIDLKKVPSNEIIETAMNLLKTRYPGVYRVLVEERNKVMALKLRAIIENHPDEKIMAIIGAGHEKEILNIITKKEIINS